VIESIVNRYFVDLERYDNHLNTPLHLACMRPKDEALKIVTLLLSKGSFSFSSIINAPNEDGKY